MSGPIQIERRAKPRPDNYAESYQRVKYVVGQWSATPSTEGKMDCPANCGGQLSMKKARTTNGNVIELHASCSTPFCVSLKE